MPRLLRLDGSYEFIGHHRAAEPASLGLARAVAVQRYLIETMGMSPIGSIARSRNPDERYSHYVQMQPVMP